MIKSLISLPYEMARRPFDVVDRLDRAALEEKSRITRVLAGRIVSALDEGQGTLPFS